MTPQRLPTGAKRAISRLFGPLAVAYMHARGQAPSGAEAALARLANFHATERPRIAPGRTRFGATMTCDTEDVIQRYVYLFGVWEPNISAWVERSLAPGDVFVDVGANVGYYTLQASRLVGERGRVFAIEASPSICKELEANLGRNSAANVEAIHAAASNGEGVLELFRASDDNRGQSTTVAARGFKLEAKVRSAPLTTLIPAAELARTRLVKLDVEGGEWPVVQGMEALLANGRQELEVIVETDPTQPGASLAEAQELYRFFDRFGLRPYAFDNSYDFTRPTFRHPVPPRAIPGAGPGEATVVFSRQRIPTSYADGRSGT